MDWFSTSHHDAIIALLEEERRLLNKGDLEGVFSLAPKKEALVAKLEANKNTHQKVATIARKARRNMDLINAALRGLKSASRVLETVARPASFSTYGARGQQNTLAPNTGQKLEQKS